MNICDEVIRRNILNPRDSSVFL
uniref:Uncharacterized protein n=1 Tax=Anguilla anguilla TaxID=7936 RepID=A0A0E9P6W3_ANGAN